MAGLVLISVFLLMLTVSWSLYDEFFGLRPWRSYQTEFSKVYSSYLEKQYTQRKADEQKFYATPQYLKLTADIKAATDAARTQDRQIGDQIDLLDRQRAAMTDSFQNSRGLVGSLTYQLEQIDEKDKSAKDSKLKELNEAKAQTYDVAWPVEGNKIEAPQIQLRTAQRSLHLDHDLQGETGRPARRSRPARQGRPGQAQRIREGKSPRPRFQRFVHA